MCIFLYVGHYNAFFYNQIAEASQRGQPGLGVNRVYSPQPQDDPRRRKPVIAEEERLLDWCPTSSLKEGLAKTIPYFEQLLTQGEVRSAVHL